MYIYNGKKVISKPNIKFVEVQLSKNQYDAGTAGLCDGYYNYNKREYPMMAQWAFGRLSKQTYDIDFNNYFIRSFLDYIEKNNLTSKPDKCNKTKLKRTITYLQNHRAELKHRYILIYAPYKFRTVSDSVDFIGGGADKPTTRELKRTVDKYIGKYITADILPELMDEITEKYTGYYSIINNYHFLKYQHLAGIGWLKRQNEQLWWCIMKHASVNLQRLINILRADGHKIYSCYIDSIQSDINVLKKYPELFTFYQAKEDKTGSNYGIVLPPSYWIDNSVAQWLSIDYRYWFEKDRTEEITIDNTQLIYLKNFAERVGHPIKDYITIDGKEIITNRLDRLDYYKFIWDFIKRKTEVDKCPIKLE